MRSLDRHLDDQELLRSLDGEGKPSAHLERCWTCRARMRELESLTGEIVHLREEHLLPSIEVPVSFGRIRAAAEVRPVPRPSWSSTVTRLVAVSSLAALLALTAVIWPKRLVSANDALRRSEQAEQRIAAGVPRAVVRQTFHLRRATSVDVRETTYDSWLEWPSGRWRTMGGDPELLSEVQTVLRENQLRPEFPLSAESFSRWASNATTQYESGVVTAHAPLPGGAGALVAAELRLRPTDWHPVSQKLILSNRTFEIRETGLSVNTVDPQDLFAMTPPAGAAPSKLKATQTVLKRMEAPKPTSVPPLESKPEVDGNVLEVEVWNALHRAGALKGSDLAVSAQGGGVVVTGTVVNREKRRQLLDAMRSLGWSRWVSVQIETLEDGRRTPNRAPSDTRRAIRATPLPIEEFLSSSPSTKDKVSIAPLANLVISVTDNAAHDLFALRRLVARFPEPRYRLLPPRSRWLLDAMGLEHIQNIRLAIVRLQAAQHPVFAQLGEASPSPSPIEQPLEEFELLHSLLHAVYAGAADTAPVEGVRAIRERLQSLGEAFADDEFPARLFTSRIPVLRSPR